MSSTALTATLEDYLEAIFNIIRRHKVARSKEIADSLNVKRPTLTVALRALAQKGYINYEPRSYVTLTESGEKAAKCVDKRHHILRDVFTEVFSITIRCIGKSGMPDGTWYGYQYLQGNDESAESSEK